MSTEITAGEETERGEAVERDRYDAVVIGAGISGIQSALDLGDQGYSVLLVEREPSIGGRMISLSKVFPTLDCASCITTPKMSAVARHPKVTILVNTEVERVADKDGEKEIELLRKPTYVDNRACIGCRLCEYACPVEVPDRFEQGLALTRAIAVPFTNAIPQKAVLDAEHCIFCGACARACPTDAIRYEQEPRRQTIRAGIVVAATGFKLNVGINKPQYQPKNPRNVISPLQMERLLAPHGPYGRVLRPSDGKIPESVAYVLCAGSRDKSIGVPYCSRVCCMYSIKQAMLLSGALPIADITIYYMDIRAFGKGFEEFYQNAKAMGIQFVRGKVARVNDGPNGDLILRVEMTEEDGRVEERQHDLVVLAYGIIPELESPEQVGLRAGSDGFLARPDSTRPAFAGIEGVFTAGCAAGPKDIVDSIIEAGAAASAGSAYLSQRASKTTKS